MVDSNTPARRSLGTNAAVEGTSPPGRARKGSGAMPKSDSTTTISAADRLRMIETAAYYRAERRGFVSGHETDDWLSAELEIDALIASTGSPTRPAAKKRSSARKPRAN
jgi:hypothetical protein